jgi:hypothetical protein
MMGQSGKSTESTDVRIWIIMCIVVLILFAEYVVVQSLLPLD